MPRSPTLVPDVFSPIKDVGDKHRGKDVGDKHGNRTAQSPETGFLSDLRTKKYIPNL